MGDVVSGTITALRQDPAVQQALARVAAEDALTLADQAAVTAIPAPLRGEAARAEWLARRLHESGTAPPGSDDVGNVLALLPGTDDAGNVPARLPGSDAHAPIVLAAHLDTVFPADADVRVRHDDGRLCAPGISDNARGLAALVRTAAVLAARPRRRPLLFVGTVGEEGAGDLRGVKHLFAQPDFRPVAFLAVDGAGVRRIVHRAVGSRRLRIRIDGPGGHSWSDRARPNPVHALGEVIAALETLRAAHAPGAGVSVGRVGGGTSINAIPTEAWLELDLRSEDDAALAAMEEQVRACVAATCARRPVLQPSIEIFGDRPGGVLGAEHVLVRTAVEATRALGTEPELAASSTDANVPLARAVPAIALGAGGEAGGTHTLAEWYRNDSGVIGLQRLVLTILALDRLL